MNKNLPESLQQKRIAVVADWLTSNGGAEKVTEEIANTFNADIFTSVFLPDQFKSLTGRVKASFLQILPPKIRKHHQFFLHLMPAAFRSLDLSEYDIIISSSASFSKAIKKSKIDQIHICYCHSPPRYLYFIEKDYVNNYPLPWFFRWCRKTVIPLFLRWLKNVDQKSIKTIDAFIANSKTTEARIEKFYKTDATVIYPNVDTKKFNAAAEQNTQRKYFLAVGRMVRYKQFPLIVEAFIKNGLPLKIGGKGPETNKCKKLIEEAQATNIELLGFVPDEDIPQLYAGARAFIFPSHEDFGIVPVEAMAAGTPVIYYNKGGATESVGAGCGVAFDEQSIESLNSAVETFIDTENTFNVGHIQAQAEKFSTENFQKNMIKYVISIQKNNTPLI